MKTRTLLDVPGWASRIVCQFCWDSPHSYLSIYCNLVMYEHNTIIGELKALSKVIHPALEISLAQGWILLRLERGITFLGGYEFIP